MSALLHGEESVLKRQLAEALDAAQASREAQRAMEERTKQLLEQAESEKAALRDELLVASYQLEQLSSEKSDLARALAAFTGASSKVLFPFCSSLAPFIRSPTSRPLPRLAGSRRRGCASARRVYEVL